MRTIKIRFLVRCIKNFYTAHKGVQGRLSPAIGGCSVNEVNAEGAPSTFARDGERSRTIAPLAGVRRNITIIIKKLCYGALITMFFLLGFSRISFAQEGLSGEEIIARSRLAFYYAGDDIRARILMELINKTGQKRVRELTMLKKDYKEGEDQKYFIYFHQPSDVKDTTFMVYKYPDKDDDRWLFIPAINLVKRIAANDKYSSFVGSDFTYEDVSGRKPEEDNHTLLREEELNGKKCLVIESIPRGASEYTKRISWVDKAIFLPLKEEFYDKQNEIYRQFEAVEIKDISGFPTITKRVMRNIKTGHHSEVTFQEVEYNLGLQDDIFSERYLRKPPSEWIR